MPFPKKELSIIMQLKFTSLPLTFRCTTLFSRSTCLCLSNNIHALVSKITIATALVLIKYITCICSHAFSAKIFMRNIDYHSYTMFHTCYAS